MKQILFLCSLLLAVATLPAQNSINPELFKGLEYRNLGAFRTGAWIADIAAPEKPDAANKYTFYVGTRAGGVWKTINNGTTFECITDILGVTSIGVVEVAASDPNIVWVGTGEAYNARSSYAGNGIYVSKDAGKTWTARGLKDSHHINRILIHPANPDIIYVAVMGHLFTPNEERGVFKTNDGGNSWQKILFIDDKTGVIDLAMNRTHPEILYAASYEKMRTAWTFEPGGKGSRIYKTVDGGSSWKMLEKGLPGGDIGRIGIDIHRGNPDILYAAIQNLNPDPEFDPKNARITNSNVDATYDALIGGEVYRSDDAGESWKKVSDKKTDVSGKAAYSFNQIYVDPVNPDNVYIPGVSMFYSFDGGKTWPMGWRGRDRFQSNFGDVRCFWIDPADPRHMMLGSDGGIYSTFDGGRSMNHYYHLPTGEIYDVEVDNSTPYNIYIGLQDHETWKGPSNSWSGSVGIEEWVITGEADGMYTKVDPENNRWLYYTGQFGLHHRVDQLTGTRVDITPRAPKGEPPYRNTWVTPLELSPKNPGIIYTGGQYLLKSIDRGNSWEKISPDLTTNDPAKINGKGHMQFCTISAISESPVKSGVIWVGTDDGRVHLTKDYGVTWEEQTDALFKLGAPRQMYVSRIVASAFAAGTAYIAKTGFRDDVFKPFVYKTTDYGQTWEDISSGLPEAPVSAICEDPSNPGVLYLGCDQGVFVSFTGGASWISFRLNMPPVPVTDLTVHPRDKDLVIGTYGRGIWITDVSPLRELADSVLKQPFYLFNIESKPQFNYSERSDWGNYHMMGDNHLRTPNETNGLEVYYHLNSVAERDQVFIRVTDQNDKETDIKASKEPGLHHQFIRTDRLQPGHYRISLLVGKNRVTKPAEVLASPVWPVGYISPGTVR
ncbi:MAG: hypothetical protein WC699_17845 [Bacteroidales bacterium]|jgi:photosystem II stability/assembly factor-like uncharacterized protein